MSLQGGRNGALYVSKNIFRSSSSDTSPRVQQMSTPPTLPGRFPSRETPLPLLVLRSSSQCAVRCFLAKCRLHRLLGEEAARQAKIYRMAARIQVRAEWTVG